MIQDILVGVGLLIVLLAIAAALKPPTFKLHPLSSVYLSGLFGVADGFKGQYKYLYIFGSAAVLVFLFLAALYESWSIPMAVVLAVPLGLFGALVAVFLREQRQV